MIALNIRRIINGTAFVDGILSGECFMTFSTHVAREIVNVLFNFFFRLIFHRLCATFSRFAIRVMRTTCLSSVRFACGCLNTNVRGTVIWSCTPEIDAINVFTANRRFREGKEFFLLKSTIYNFMKKKIDKTLIKLKYWLCFYLKNHSDVHVLNDLIHFK